MKLISHRDFVARLPPEERAAVRRRSAELINEYETLQEMRKARALTQKKLAKKLGVAQVAVSRMERRSDLLLSTLRSYVEAMGGSLDLVVSFPGRKPVKLATIGLDDEEPLAKPALKNKTPVKRAAPARKAAAKKPARKASVRQAAE
jgi:transcriptional regulator with XRE-family HTH domain